MDYFIIKKHTSENVSRFDTINTLFSSMMPNLVEYPIQCNHIKQELYCLFIDVTETKKNECFELKMNYDIKFKINPSIMICCSKNIDMNISPLYYSDQLILLKNLKNLLKSKYSFLQKNNDKHVFPYRTNDSKDLTYFFVTNNTIVNFILDCNINCQFIGSIKKAKDKEIYTVDITNNFFIDRLYLFVENHNTHKRYRATQLIFDATNVNFKIIARNDKSCEITDDEFICGLCDVLILLTRSIVERNLKTSNILTNKILFCDKNNKKNKDTIEYEYKNVYKKKDSRFFCDTVYKYSNKILKHLSDNNFYYFTKIQIVS